jgi:hypothetical protein
LFLEIITNQMSDEENKAAEVSSPLGDIVAMEQTQVPWFSHQHSW